MLLFISSQNPSETHPEMHPAIVVLVVPAVVVVCAMVAVVAIFAMVAVVLVVAGVGLFTEKVHEPCRGIFHKWKSS
jgi:hypothetical protein